MNELQNQRGGPAGRDDAWLMLAEFSHRVGNELSAALAALRQAQRACRREAAPRDFLDEAVSRLENFGQLHHLLDRNRSWGNFNERLEALCQAVLLSKAAARGVHVALSADDIRIDGELAWTICVVASELLTNVLKHAFCDDDGGIVVVDLREEREMLFLSVADNGTPAAARKPDRAVSAGSGAGLGIVTRLIARFDGAISRECRASGTTVTVSIPLRRLIQ